MDTDQYYAMVDSGTNAIIVPLHPSMKGEIAECQVPSATVKQVYSHNGAKRLVVALPNSAILVSQEWLTTVAGWTFVSGPKPGLKKSARGNKVYPSGGRQAHALSMKNGLPYLSKELFWMAMGDIAKHATLVSGHSWQELREMLDNQTYEPQPQIYSVKAVTVSEASSLLFSQVAHTKHFEPWKAREKKLSLGLSTSILLPIPVEVVFLEQRNHDIWRADRERFRS